MEKDALTETTKMISANVSTSTDKNENLSQILEHWIRIEKCSIEKYRLLAQQTTNPHAKALFERLSSEGTRHAMILGIIKGMLIETGEINHSIDISPHVTLPEDTESRNYSTDIEATYHAMKSHLKLEHQLEKKYEMIAEKIKDTRATALFHGLAEDERSHHKEMLTIIKTFKRTFKDFLKN